MEKKEKSQYGLGRQVKAMIRDSVPFTDIFADGDPRMKPLLIFEGTGQRIPDREKRQYDPRVVVKFQENAWCNEEMTFFWLRNMWKKPNMSGQPHDRLLILFI